MNVGVARAMRYSGTVALFLLAAIHANWARGSSWPASSEQRLAERIIGRDEMPSAGACLAVAALLAVGGSLVAGLPRSRPRLQRIGAAGVAATLAFRGLVGITGVTPLTSETFLRWDRRLYSPLCLLLAVLSMAGAVPKR